MIRLKRIGRRNDPSFRVVVTEKSRGPKSGDYLERVGFYNPQDDKLELDGERIQHWISNGAQPSETVHNLLISAGIIKGKKINVLPQKSPVVSEVEEKEEKPEAAEEASATEAAEEVESQDEAPEPEAPKETKAEEPEAEPKAAEVKEETKEEAPEPEAKEEPKEEAGEKETPEPAELADEAPEEETKKE